MIGCFSGLDLDVPTVPPPPVPASPPARLADLRLTPPPGDTDWSKVSGGSLDSGVTRKKSHGKKGKEKIDREVALFTDGRGRSVSSRSVDMAGSATNRTKNNGMMAGSVGCYENVAIGELNQLTAEGHEQSSALQALQIARNDVSLAREILNGFVVARNGKR